MNQIDAMLAEHADALKRREHARQAFIAADADVHALTRVICDQAKAGVPGASLSYNMPWLKAGERASAAMMATLLPEVSPQQIADAYTRWTETLSRLVAA
jgi:hypothetical protein